MSAVTEAGIAGDESPELVDLLHLGRPCVIGAWRMGEVIIDPGPTSCLEQLLPTLERHPPRVIALTHIHLDHAGAAGVLARRFPDAEVWVHERGARHMIDPSRLLLSAARLYGEHMEELWGEVVPVPRERLRVLSGGESLGPFEVAYTPGHASHHVCYLHRASGWAFTGDVAGVRIAEGPTIAPTPPPDIDLRAWRRSIQLIEAWKPEVLAATHFGAHEDVSRHLLELRGYLDEIEALPLTVEEAGFIEALTGRVASSTTAAIAGTYGQAMPAAQSYAGLARYLQGERRSEAAAN